MTDAESCAAVVMETGLLINRVVRTEIRQHRPAGLTLAQFRSLAFIAAHPGASPSELADYLGLSGAAASKQLDHLTADGLVMRRTTTADRRRREIRLTAVGEARLATAVHATRDLVRTQLSSLTASERRLVTRAMQLVKSRVAPPTPHEPAAAHATKRWRKAVAPHG